MVLVPKPLEVVTPEQNTLVTQEKEYSQTKSEWAADNREKVLADADITGVGNEIIYTVPEGKNLYIHYIYLTYNCTGAGAGARGGCYIRASEYTTIPLITLRVDDSLKYQDSICCNFNLPFLVSSNENISLGVNIGSCDVKGMIYGYLE